jgi:3alpha(or 20beta)-hydroxysteroid dehydrogenase
MDFSGKTAIVTGGAQGIGAATARGFVARGGRVLVGDLLEAEGRALAAELGPSAAFLRMDVGREGDWQAAVAAAEALGPLTSVVNNAGVYRLNPIARTTAEDFEQQFRVNQLGVFFGLKLPFEAMCRAGGGSIVNMSSVAGLRATPNGIAYSATKWAVRGMTKVAAGEYGPHGIRVNSVHPGFVDTALTSFMHDGHGDLLEGYRKALPLGRFSTADEVAELVLFLLSDAAASITGSEVKIDSGSML